MQPCCAQQHSHQDCCAAAPVRCLAQLPAPAAALPAFAAGAVVAAAATSLPAQEEPAACCPAMPGMRQLLLSQLPSTERTGVPAAAQNRVLPAAAAGMPAEPACPERGHATQPLPAAAVVAGQGEATCAGAVLGLVVLQHPVLPPHAAWPAQFPATCPAGPPHGLCWTWVDCV